jgi:hypothetical protein
VRFAANLILIVTVAAGALLAVEASASTVACPSSGTGDSISLNITSLTSCSTANGNAAFSPTSGYSLITANSFSPEVTSGSFSPGSNFTSLELFIQSDTGTPHPDQFVMIFPGVSSFTWSLVSGGTNKVSEADLYGVDPVVYGVDPVVTPLPAALPLFAGGLGLVGILARRRNKYAVATAQ